MLNTAQCEVSELFFNDLLQKSGREHRLLRITEQTENVFDFARSVAAGLARRPRRLDCRFLYDADGSELYECICKQPEYYPTRIEAAILAQKSPAICRRTGPVTLFELGSGCSVKTDYLLAAYTSVHRQPIHYVPIDVSASALQQAMNDITSRYPTTRVTGINGTYEDAFRFFETASPAMIIFLGSTIGNLDEREAHRFWQAISAHIAAGDYFLLGVDLVKESHLLEAAYDDAAGVTASFTRNLFHRMNRELGARLDPGAIEHIARYNSQRERVEIYGRFNTAQTVHVGPLDQCFEITAGEEILIEISRKFRPDALPDYFADYGLEVQKTYTDEQQWFALLLLQRT